MEITNSKLSLSGNSPTDPAQALGQSRLLVRLGGLGIVYSVLFVAATVLFGNDPGTGTGAGRPTVVRFYTAHRTSELAGVFMVAVAAIAFAFFLSALRRRLEVTDDDRFLSGPLGGVAFVITPVWTLVMGVVLLRSAATDHGPEAASTTFQPAQS